MIQAFHPSILREYDIRGIYGQTLSEEDARAVGKCFGYVIRQKGGSCVAVGKDGRLSSDSLENALIDGLLSQGINVTKLGLCPTPLVYYAVKELSMDGGIMITGSHNEASFNGFKMTLYDRPFYGQDIQKFLTLSTEINPADNQGTVQDLDIRDAYVDRLLKNYDFTAKTLNIIWDIGNGAAGSVIRKLVNKLPGKHTVLFENIDGTFPNHHPDPTKEKNLEILKNKVLMEKADLGIAFDGDGDRIGVIDDRGNFWLGDFLMVLFSRNVLQNLPKSKIIIDIKSSEVLVSDIKKHGGIPLMMPTGHSLIKAQMSLQNAPLAGETSGHIFFADQYYGFDDALYASIRLLGIVAKLVGPLSNAYESLPSIYNTPEIRIFCDNTKKKKVIDDIKKRLLSRYDSADILTIDGVRVKEKDGWWLLRASNTEEVLVCRCESITEQGLDRLKEKVNNLLDWAGIQNIQ